MVLLILVTVSSTQRVTEIILIGTDSVPLNQILKIFLFLVEIALRFEFGHFFAEVVAVEVVASAVLGVGGGGEGAGPHSEHIIICWLPASTYNHLFLRTFPNRKTFGVSFD